MEPITFGSQPAIHAGREKSGGGASCGATGAGSSSEGEGQRLAKACSEFEAIFIEQLFKTMRESLPEVDLMRGGRAEEIYTGMLDQQIAVEMSRGQGSIGLASQMLSRLLPERSFEG